MSLSTQLARGTLALPMLSLFALLALTAGQSNGAIPADLAQVEMTAPSICSLPPKPVLILAQAPADLGQLAFRSGHTCRA